ncbi:MAG: methylmalonyl-CoA carboxyltransferase [Clostridia bacterium]|nr:methylmalonyl-CoA carboxyltransferase [Clostridia bacterium]
MSVERNLPLMQKRREAALKGNAEQIQRQHDAGKLTARERVAKLFDEQSFVELDTLIADAGVVTGYGLVEGRPAYVYAQDYTVCSGAVGEKQSRKILKAMGLAEKTGAPIIALADSQGARLDEGMAAVNAYAAIMSKSADISGVIPQITAVLGPCGGGAAMCAEMSDVIVIGKNGQLFVNGPLVVSAKTGKNITMEEMAGAAASVKSGAAHIEAGSDEEAIACVRKIVAMLPGNNMEDAPYAFEAEDDVNRELPSLNALGEVTDIRGVIAQIADNGQVIELGATYGTDVVTALVRLGGSATGVVASDPAVDGGRLTADGSRKAARFVRFLDSFSIPTVTLVDTLGAAQNTACQGEQARALAALMGAYADSTSPRVAVITGNAIGTAATALASHAASDVIYAWPGAVISPVTAQIAAQLYGEKELHESKNPDETRQKLEQDYQANVADGLNAALSGNVDDVIEPALTRQMLAAALEMLAGKRETKLSRKHGNLPL